jgi:hypothetical protein
LNRYLKVLLVAAILLCFVGAASAKTEPTKESITNFITNFEAPAGEDYLESFYNAYTSEFAGNCDLWKDYVSTYYQDSGNTRGYSSIYIDNIGNIVSPGCEAGEMPVKSHKYSESGAETPNESEPPVNKDRQSRHTPKEIGPDIDTREFCTDAVKKVKEKSSSRIAVPKGIDETEWTSGEIVETVRKPIKETVDTISNEEKLKEAVQERVKEKSNNIIVPRENCEQIINTREACTQIVTKARDSAPYSNLGIPQDESGEKISNDSEVEVTQDECNNTSCTIDAIVENYEESEDKNPGYLRKLLNYFLN